MTWLGAQAPTPERDRLDLRLARLWRQAGSEWEASLVLQSALGGYYEYENARYRFDRRAYASLRQSFRSSHTGFVPTRAIAVRLGLHAPAAQ